jgi:hypothetical protein
MQPWLDTHFTLSTAALVRRVHDARDHTLALVADLEAQCEVPLLALVHLFRWELGHVAFVYEAFVLQLLGQTTPLLVGAENLYDSFKIDHDDRWSLPLPSRQQTLEYMQRVLDAVVERLQGYDPSAQETYLYLLSVLHEDMHGEALTYLRQILSDLAPHLGSTPVALRSGPLPGDVAIPGGTFSLGATPDQPFVCDNEKWPHLVEVAPFRMARAPSPMQNLPRLWKRVATSGGSGGVLKAGSGARKPRRSTRAIGNARDRAGCGSISRRWYPWNPMRQWRTSRGMKRKPTVTGLAGGCPRKPSGTWSPVPNRPLRVPIWTHASLGGPLGLPSPLARAPLAAARWRATFGDGLHLLSIRS